MNSNIRVKNLIESCHWRQFMESTASALQINLVLLIEGTENSISVNETCPVCNKVFPPLIPISMSSTMEASLNIPNNQNITLEVFELINSIKVIAREFQCCNVNVILSFHDRVLIAKELLNNLLAFYIEPCNKGQMTSEFSTLRKMNQIILSKFQGDNKALGRALDLILSAIIILFDAKGSWIQYNIGDRKYLMTKGDCGASPVAASIESGKPITAEIKSPVIQGLLGINAPEDIERTISLLHFIVEECIIVFETDHLIKRMESGMSLVLGAIKSLVLIIDSRKNICYANRFAEELLCCSTTELLGCPAASIIAPWNDHIITGSSKVIKGIKDPLNNISGQRLVDWGVYPLTGVEGIRGWLVIADDRTDFYRLQEIGEQAERMVNTSTLLGILAHEIRNPLATFRGLLQLIRLKKESSGISGYIDLGIREVDRVTRLLNDFLLMGKPLDVSTVPIDLKSFLEDILPLLNGETNNTSIEIKTNFHAVPPVQVDPGQLTQVIINLVRNAFEELNQHGQVYISLQKYKNEFVKIVVRDTGPGIATEVLNKIFQPFFTTKSSGTGLGLAASQAIIMNHGGVITVENHPQGGAVFTILLPIKKYTNGELNKIDVMLVTDDEMLRLPIEQVFRAESINSLSVSNIDNTFYMLNWYFPSIIIMDKSIINPQIYGSIKIKYPEVKILIIGEDKDLEVLKDVHVMLQPINYEKLISKIKSLL